jgi:hypothetical protein
MWQFTKGAARYLSYAYSKLGNWPSAITSYNHGVGGMKRAQNQVGRDFARIVRTYIQYLPGDSGKKPILGALLFSQQQSNHSSLCR